MDREKYRQNGFWRTALGSHLTSSEIDFTVAVRGVTPDRRTWSLAVPVTAAAPRLEVNYTIRRLRHLTIARTYTVEITTDRPPVECEVVIGFSTADHLPESLDECVELDRAYLLYQRTTVQITVPRRRGPGWLRCFVAKGQDVTLTDPHSETLRIRSWTG